MSTKSSSSGNQESGEHPNCIDIAGKSIELGGTSGRSTLPQGATVVATRVDLAIAGKRIELGGTSGRSTLPQVAAVVVTRVR
jgi:hypothetical protein